VEIGRITLGCGNFGGIGSAPQFFGQGESEEEAFAIMDAAWAFGIRSFDTADASRRATSRPSRRRSSTPSRAIRTIAVSRGSGSCARSTAASPASASSESTST
jgi:hypothetical protein